MGLMYRITLVLHAAMAARQIVFVRHGLSKMNVALGRQPWAVHKSNGRGASPPLLKHDLHAIDATHWLIRAQALGQSQLRRPGHP